MNILEQIKQSNLISANSAGINDDINLCQQRLCAYGAAPMPFSYTKFLEKYNGIYGNGISLFGVGASGLYDDVFTKNSMTDEPSKHRVFLGENLIEFLCYDWYQKAYLIILKQDTSQTKEFSLLEDALSHILQDYLN